MVSVRHTLGEKAMPSVITSKVAARVWPATRARAEAMESVECMVSINQTIR
jgi:hypothetical protein